MNLMQQHINDMVAGVERRMANSSPSLHRERRKDWPRRVRFDAVMTGEDRAFWWTPDQPYAERYDGEQELTLFDAVRVAVALPAASPAERWKVIERAIRAIAFDYSEERD